MNKTKIEWCDSSWNPVTGCRHDCPYCYARNIAHRFGGYHLDVELDGKHQLRHEPLDGEAGPDGLMALDASVRRMLGGAVSKAPYPYDFTPTLHRYRLEEPVRKTKGQTIFVCSMADLFGRWVPTNWIVEVLDACMKAPQHNYLFLTKNPARYAELDKLALLPQEKNFWYGATATSFDQMDAACDAMSDLPVKVRTFLSAEPLMCDLAACSAWWLSMDGKRPYFDWVILGAMTGSGAKKSPVDPKWVENIARSAGERLIPVFMKESLVPVVGEAGMLREFPWNLK